MQAATTQIATNNMKTMHPTAAPTITVVLLPSKHVTESVKYILAINCICVVKPRLDEAAGHA